MAYIIYPNIEAITSDMLVNSDICAEYFNKSKNMDQIINDFACSKLFDRYTSCCDAKLSELFLEWTKDIFFHDKFTESLVSYVVDEDSFDEINLKVCNSFRAYVEEHSSYILNTYYVRVIINLLFRDIVLLDYLSEDERKKITGYLHIPLDRSSLMAIRLILNRKEYDNNLGLIPQELDEDYIDSYIKYYTIQKFFNDISVKTQVPAIYYYNLIKYKEKLSHEANSILSASSIYEIDNVADDQNVYEVEDFIASRVYDRYSSNVKEILNTLFEKLAAKNIEAVVLNRKKYIYINSSENDESNLVRVWINNRSVHIEITGKSIKKYSSSDEITDSLIKSIEEIFSK